MSLPRAGDRVLPKKMGVAVNDVTNDNGSRYKSKVFRKTSERFDSRHLRTPTLQSADQRQSPAIQKMTLINEWAYQRIHQTPDLRNGQFPLLFIVYDKQSKLTSWQHDVWCIQYECIMTVAMNSHIKLFAHILKCTHRHIMEIVMEAPRLYSRIFPRQIRPRHVNGAKILIALWYIILVASNYYDFDVTKLLIHPIRHFSAFLFFPLVSAWAAWNIRDGRKDNELNLHLLSVNYSFLLASRSAQETFTEETIDNYITRVNEYMTATNRHLRTDSRMYAVSLLFGTYSTLCIAKAAIERIGT